jgi:hypothetical protein
MNVNTQDIIDFSKKLLNIKTPPILWSSIRTDGNCFFHAIDYAYTGKLKNFKKVIELRQTIAKTMKDKISGVSYHEFMHEPWPYAEIDVIMATAKYYKKTIIVISMNHYGGVTMVRPKNIKIGNPLFLICHANHYVPFHSSKVKITKQMRHKLEDIEKNQKGSLQNENGCYVSSFLLKDLNTPTNSLILTRKRLRQSKSKTSKKLD